MFQLAETAVSPEHHHPGQAKCPAGLLKAANKDSKKNQCSPFELLNSTKTSNCSRSSYADTENMWSSDKKCLFVHIKIHRKAEKSEPVLSLLTGRTGWNRFCHYYINILFLHLLMSNQNCDPGQSKLIQSKTETKSSSCMMETGRKKGWRCQVE